MKIYFDTEYFYQGKELKLISIGGHLNNERYDVLLAMTIITKISEISGRQTIEQTKEEWEEVITGFKTSWVRKHRYS